MMRTLEEVLIERNNKREGYETVRAGAIEIGDLVYNTARKDFDTVKQQGTVRAEQCWLVLRRKAN